MLSAPLPCEVTPQGLHFHGLRRTGNTIATSSGASTRDLMARMGHPSDDAALSYQHATSVADRAVVEKLNERNGIARAREGTRRCSGARMTKPPGRDCGPDLGVLLWSG